jgi:hypothetical protein
LIRASVTTNGGNRLWFGKQIRIGRAGGSVTAIPKAPGEKGFDEKPA